MNCIVYAYHDKSEKGNIDSISPLLQNKKIHDEETRHKQKENSSL